MVSTFQRSSVCFEDRREEMWGIYVGLWRRHLAFSWATGVSGFTLRIGQRGSRTKGSAGRERPPPNLALKPENSHLQAPSFCWNDVWIWNHSAGPRLAPVTTVYPPHLNVTFTDSSVYLCRWMGTDGDVLFQVCLLSLMSALNDTPSSRLSRIGDAIIEASLTNGGMSLCWDVK